MKILKYIPLFIVWLSFSSCEKFLDVAPQENASDEVTITDKKSAESALNGLYRALAADQYYARTFQFIIYLQGGDLGWGDSRTVNREFIQNNVRADNEEVLNAWRAIYKTINQANHVIAKVPPITSDATLTQALKDNIVGQAYFIRALAYFDLARTWGGVQIVTTPTEKVNDKYGIPRSSLAATYAQVLSDLTNAETLLANSTTTNRIRVTKKRC